MSGTAEVVNFVTNDVLQFFFVVVANPTITITAVIHILFLILVSLWLQQVLFLF
jgi:hypothetical protein